MINRWIARGKLEAFGVDQNKEGGRPTIRGASAQEPPNCVRLNWMDLLHVESHDGTRIAAHVDGAGPPLLLVHGATADHSTTWRFVGPMFEQRFTVYRMDRRGRGESGDGDDYSIEREFEDVAALVDAIGDPVLVVGHSY